MRAASLLALIGLLHIPTSGHADDYALTVLNNCLQEAPHRMEITRRDLSAEVLECGQLVVAVCAFSSEPADCSNSVGERLLGIAFQSGWSYQAGSSAPDIRTFDGMRTECEQDAHAPRLLPRADPISHCVAEAGAFALQLAALQGFVTAGDLK